MAEQPPSHSEPDQPGFALVRPYVADVTEPADSGKHRIGRVLPSWARPTESLPMVPAPAGAAPIPVPAGPLDAQPMSGRRIRITLAAVVVVVLAGTAAGAYAAMHMNGGPVTVGAGPLQGQLLPAQTPSSPPLSPRVAAPPTTAHTSRATVTPSLPGPSLPGPSPSTSAVFGAGPPVPSQSPHALDPVNLALHRTILATGTNGPYVAGNAVDGDPDTYWEGSSGSRHTRTQTILLDLGSAASIDRIVLRLPPLATWPARTQTISISGSTDGWSYGTITRSTTYAFDPGAGNTVTITFAATDVRYLQFGISANTGAPAGQLSEIEIFAA